MEVLISRSMKQSTNKFYDAFAEPIQQMVYQGYQDNILHNPRLVMYKLMGTTIDDITITKKHGKNIMGAINVMKYRGLIENHWTIDTTRSVYKYTNFKDKSEVLHAAAQSFYVDRWKNQPTNILLMCEASGYLGVVKHISDKFRCPYVPAKGDMSVQIKIELAQSLNENHTDIIYFGDYDTKGLQIPQTIEADIRELNPEADFTLHRLFINKSDIEQYGLAIDENGGVQMEQLDENIAIDTATDFIEKLMDFEKWEVSIENEKSVRDEILEVA